MTPARAQVAPAPEFLSPAWRLDEDEGTAATRSRRSGARRAAPDADWVIDEDDERPQVRRVRPAKPAARRSAARSTVARLSAKARPAVRRVKVASIPPVTAIDAAPSATGVQAVQPAEPAKANDQVASIAPAPAPRKDAAAAAIAQPPTAAAKPAARGTRVASLGAAAPTPEIAKPAARSLTGGAIAWRVSSSCLAGNLRSVLASVASLFGPVTVNSTCRSPGHNRRVGGASKSWHLTGNAADFRMRGNIRSAMAFMRPKVGGLKHYGGGRFHIDNGPRRSF